MKWFLVYLCDEDTVNTSTTYHDLIFARDEIEARELAILKQGGGLVCIGVRVATDEEVTLMSR